MGNTQIGGLRDFTGLPLEVLRRLIAGNFVELDDWNGCPGVAKAFLPFMERHPEFLAHGYAVSWERDDARVTIEGIEKTGSLTMGEVIDFANTFAGADEMQLTDDYARCWYD